MLPHIKRPARDDDGDVEIEVVDVRNVDGTELSDDDPTMLATNTLFPKGSSAKGSNSSRPPSGRSGKPNVSLSNLTNKKKAVTFGDEPTRLMPAKHGAKSSVLQAPPVSVPPPAALRAPASVRPPPPAAPSVRPGALPDARGPGRASGAPGPASSPPPMMVQGTAAEFRPPPVPSSRNPRPPASFRDREDSHTMLRPALNDKSIHEPKVSIAVPSAGAIKAQVDAARAKRLADQKARAAETLEVTPVSISERFVVQGRPAAPWAFAFVAMGIFAGLATAMFTGGRASAIAAFIDPGHLAVAAAAAQPAAPPMTPAAAPAAIDPAANMLTTTPNPPIAAAPLDVGPATPNVFAVGRASTKSAEPAPAVHTTPKADPPTPKPAPVAKADPKPETPKADPKPAIDTKTADTSSHTSKPSSHGKHSGGDVDSAAAADALAKAQLENSL